MYWLPITDVSNLLKYSISQLLKSFMYCNIYIKLELSARRLKIMSMYFSVSMSLFDSFRISSMNILTGSLLFSLIKLYILMSKFCDKDIFLEMLFLKRNFSINIFSLTHGSLRFISLSLEIFSEVLSDKNSS